MVSYVVVGASRGIGLEYVRQLAALRGSIVIAVVRKRSTSTHLHAAIVGLNNVHVLEGDVANYSSLEAAAKATSSITGGKLDCLIHVAARTSPATVWQGFDDFNTMEELDADLVDAFEINALGVVHSITAFLPLLRASSAQLKKIIVLCKGAADPKAVRRIGLAHMVAYAITQAAARMATAKWAAKLQNEGFVVISLSPGLVNTSGTRPDTDKLVTLNMNVVLAAQKDVSAGFQWGLESPERSVTAQLRVIRDLKPSDNGLFLKHTGEEWAVP